MVQDDGPQEVEYQSELEDTGALITLEVDKLDWKVEEEGGEKVEIKEEELINIMEGCNLLSSRYFVETVLV